MEKTRTVSLQLDGKKNKKSKPKKKDLSNGGVSQDGGEGSSANIKEKMSRNVKRSVKRFLRPNH